MVAPILCRPQKGELEVPSLIGRGDLVPPPLLEATWGTVTFYATILF